MEAAQTWPGDPRFPQTSPMAIATKTVQTLGPNGDVMLEFSTTLPNAAGDYVYTVVADSGDHDTPLMSPGVKVLSAMPSQVVVEVKCGVEEGVVFMGVAFRGLPVGRSRWRLPQSRDRALQGSTHYGYCAHGSHLLPMDHDHGNDRTPATRCAIGIKPVAVSPANAPPTATPSSVMGP